MKSHNFLYGLTGKFDFFYKQSSPGLDDETLGSSEIRVNVNINRILVRGLEFTLTYNPLTNILFIFTLTLISLEPNVSSSSPGEDCL